MGRGVPALLVVLLCGCASLSPRPIADCPGPLASFDEIPPGTRLRERVRVEAGEHVQSFTLVLERQDDRAVVVAHDAIGAKLFSVVDREGDTDVEAMPAPVLLIPPLNVVRDLHRARFITDMEGDDPRVFDSVSAVGLPVTTIEHVACGYTAHFVSMVGTP